MDHVGLGERIAPVAGPLECVDEAKAIVTKLKAKPVFVRCVCEPGRTSQTDKGAAALSSLPKRRFVYSFNGTRVLPQDCHCCRAQAAIRAFAGMFYKQEVAYRLDADLRIALDLISQGLENEIPDDLREEWAKAEDDLDCEPWVSK